MTLALTPHIHENAGARRRLRLTVGGLALFAALWALAGPARAAGLRQGSSSPSALASATDSLTGASNAGQLDAKYVCAAPGAGRAGCLAQMLAAANGRALALTPASAIDPARIVASAQSPFSSPLAAPQSAPGSAAEPAAGTPAYLQQAYDLSYLSQTAGTGDTVAIVDAYDDPNAESDLAAYRANYGLPVCSTANGCFRKLDESGGTNYPAPDADWAVEISLDLDAVSALCPNCHITLVEANSNYLSDLNAAEAQAVALGAQQVSNSWAGASPAGLSGWHYPGTAIVAAAGDEGWWGNGAANYPASLESVTSVGGTTLEPSPATASAPRGFSESAWGYQYTGTWYGTGSGCDTSEPKPAWQTDTGCAGRTSTDISADADPNTGLRVYDTYQTGGGSGWFAVGGTSLASPLSAAYYALTQAQSANPAPPQWAYANAAELNDPASGENGACGNYLCQAGAGYDGPTGNGSISGTVATGAPGIGGPGPTGTYPTTTTGSGTQVSAGVYPNGLDTSLYIQYGTTSAYGQQTAAVDVGSSSSPQLATLTISGLTGGASYHYRIVAQNADGTTYGYDFTLTAGQGAPVNQTQPSISGTPQQGSALSASTGTWTGVGDSYSYQWQRSTNSGQTWAPIASATGSAYTPGASDVGAELEVTVSAADAQGSATATSAPTGAVTSGAPVNTTPPSVTGTAQSGQTLSASTGTWSGAGGLTYAYQWSESSGQGYQPIAGATSSTYALQNSDAGQSIEVSVTATNAYGSANATSTPTVVGSGAPVNHTPPSISGTVSRAQTLSVSNGIWQGQPTITYAYQWLRSSASGYVAISKATAASYTLTAADVGQTLEITVTAKNSYGSAPVTVGPTATVGSGAPVNQTPATITGTPQRPDKLTADVGVWAPAASSYTYQWLRSSASGYVAIAGATGSSYTLTAADVGRTLELTVKAKNSYGSAPVTVGPTATVSSGAPVNQTPATITGTPQRADKLTAHAGTWTPASTYAYQWLQSAGSGYVAIAKATAASYTLTAADEGTSIEVAVTAKTSYGATATATSAATPAVAPAPPVASKPPSIAGATQRGSVLHETSTGTWTGAGNSYSYQWADCNTQGENCQPITGATHTSYTLTHTDVGQTVRFEVIATNTDATVTAASAPSAVIAARAPAASKNPTIAGSARVASTLRESSIGSWTGLGNSYSYQWLDCSAQGGSCQPIQGQTATTYTVASSDAGDRIALQVSATNPDGSANATSAPSALVPGANPSAERSSAPARGAPARRTPTR